MTYCIVCERDSRSHWSNDNVEIDQSIRDDNGKVTPFIWKEFRERECSELTVSSPETKKDVSCDGLADSV